MCDVLNKLKNDAGEDGGVSVLMGCVVGGG
jgi:hypothetical protein